MPFRHTFVGQALVEFQVFIKQCGGVFRGELWRESIDNVFNAYQQTGLNPTPKVHIISHVPKYFEILDKLLDSCSKPLGLGML